MGQYYKPCSLNSKEWLYSHKYDNGSKLMEHSYIKNKLVMTVESLLAEGKKWFKHKLVWAGDYADGETEGKNDTIYSRLKDEMEIIPNKSNRYYRFLINHDLEEFVDKDKVRDINGIKGYKIHPLPLLTCEGNGRGGGDFRGGSSFVGNWARNRISVSDERPKGFAEIIPHFNEEGGKKKEYETVTKVKVTGICFED